MCELSRRRRALVAPVVAFALLVALASSAAAETYKIVVTQLDLTAYPTVRLVASVTDAEGRPVKGLRAEDFVVTEADRPVAADVRLASAVAPVSAVLAMDSSGSMANAMPDAKAAAISLIRTLSDADRGAVISFNTVTSIARDLTTDRSMLEAAVGAITAGGNTALYDAIDQALVVAASGPPGPRRALILLTDGADNSSAATLDDVRERIKAAALPVFLIGLGDQVDGTVLDQLASASVGGRVLLAPSSSDLAAVYDQLAEQLKSDVSISLESDTSTASVRTLVIALKREGATLARTEVAVTPPSPSATPVPSAIMTATPAPVPTTEIRPASTTDMMPLAIAVLGAAAAGAVVLWLYVVDREHREGDRRRRLERFVSAAPAEPRPARPTPPIADELRGAVRPLRSVLPSGWVARTDRWLTRAGEPFGMDAYEFIALRIAAAVVLAITFLLVTSLIRAEALFVALGAILGMFTGYTLPGILLSIRIHERKRVMSRALPGALDMLALSTAAGLTLDGAIAQAASRWQTPLSVELRRYLAEMRIGRSRAEALRALAARVDLPEMTHLATVILQADVLGVPIANVLRERAIELRRERRQHAEELARVAPVKMLFPMALLIFPALFVVILGPIVPAILSAFGS